MGRLESSCWEADPEDVEEALDCVPDDAVVVAEESVLVESSEPVRRCRTGRSGSSEAEVELVVGGVLAAVESGVVDGVESGLLESVRRCRVGLEVSAALVEVAFPEVDESELPESVRRFIVGREESSAEAVVLSAGWLPKCGRVPPLAITWGSGPLFFAA